MASSTAPAPSTPVNTARRVPINRSLTLPTNFATPSRPANPSAVVGTANDIETLYFHPDVKVFRFTARSTTSSPSGRPQSAGPGTLAWASPTERNEATGQLEIYRANGSLMFLHSGPLLQPILPKSNCWCVDGKSKFALRIAPDTYLRIELPGETGEDLEEAENFKTALKKVLFYERTPCPFSRTFSVDLPEEQPEIRKKRKKSLGPAKKWKLASGRRWKPEDGSDSERMGGEDSGSSAVGSDDDSERDESGGDKALTEPPQLANEVKEMKISTPPSARARGLAALRSITSPPQLALQSSPPPSRLRARVDVDGSVEVSEVVGGEQLQNRDAESRLRAYQAIPMDMPPSPPDSSAGLEYLESQEQNEGGAKDDRTGGSKEAEDLHSREEGDAATLPDRGAETRLVARDETGMNKTSVVHNDTPGEEQPPPLDDAADNDSSILIKDPEPSSDRRREPTDDLKLDSSSDEIEENTLDLTQPIPATIAQTDLSVNEGSDPHNEDSEPPSHPKAAVLEHASESAPPEDQHRPESSVDDDRPTTPTRQITPEDPYAAIQARILARRSIGVTTSFHPSHTSPTRRSNSSTSSSATLSSNKSTVSRRSHSSQRQEAFATAMVKKACSVFLGPPAHLVAIMLHIAARFAKSAFGVDSMFYVESPMNEQGRVPGSYRLKVDGETALNDDDALDDSDWEEDDFGVPLRSPVRLAGMEGVRERRRWDID